MPNKMEELIGEEEEEKEPETNEEMETLKQSVSAIGENLAFLTDKLTEIEEKLTQPSATETPAEEEEWVPKTWSEVDRRIEEKARLEAEAKLAEKEREIMATREEEAKIRETIDKEFDKQLAEMEKAGIIPPIQNMDNPDDPGKACRREVFGYAAVLGTTNLKKVGEALQREHERGYVFDVRSGRFLRSRTSGFGQTVPVSSSSGRSGSGKRTIPYKELHNLSMDELVRRSQE